MQYFEWIEKYKTGKLSAADRLAFEHEVEENEDLNAEFDAVNLTDTLLAEVAGLPDGPTSSAAAVRGNFRNIYILTISLFLVAVAIFTWQHRSSYKEQIEVNRSPLPALPVPENTESIPEILAPKPESDRKKVKRPVAATTAPGEPNELKTPSAIQNIPAPQQKSPQLAEVTVPDAPNESLNSKPEVKLPSPTQEKIAVYTVSAVIDTVLAHSSDIALTATEKIVLKPGFHAKAGTTFKAKVNNGPLFEKKGTPN